jgi:3-oxoacyl-[acyl-carrier-protein] synthase-3
MAKVYITNIQKFLPGKAIENSEMEEYLGYINDTKSKAKPIILRNNRIEKRYYAIDKNGKSTHTNAQLTAECIKKLENENFKLSELELLACGTTSPDQLLPSHASMVHGLLKLHNLEYMSTSGSCNSGMLALKHAYLSILSGNSTNAITTGSEKISTWLQAKNFEEETKLIETLEKKPMLAFQKEFLRWMLSDGAAAALVQNKPNEKSISLEIDWIDITSFAGEIDTCMYAGMEITENGEIIPWRDFTEKELIEKSIMTLSQDTRMLGDNIINFGVKFLYEIIKKRNYDVSKVDWFLPHLSSMFFKDKIFDGLKNMNLEIPEEKWFVNLPFVGNVGSASAFLMLEELFNGNKLKKGQKILIMVPESARFSYTFVSLTVV